MSKKLAIICLSCILGAFLFACEPENAASPEQAVYLKIRESPNILTNTIQVQPPVQFRNSYFVLTSYNLAPQNQDPEQHCMAIYVVSKIEKIWEINRAPYSCSSNAHRDVFGISTGVGLTTKNNPNEPYSYVAVETVIDDAVWVDITWQDDLVQRAPVINEYFFAIRDGAFYPVLFVVFDKEGKETYTSTFDPPP